MPGVYRSDLDHMVELGQAMMSGRVGDYIERYVSSVSSHAEMLEKRVGEAKLSQLAEEETIREGYS
jgi:uncharacterized protein YdbL (DUF1318 family)